MNEYKHVRVLHQDIKKFEFNMSTLKHLVPKSFQQQQHSATGRDGYDVLVFDPTKSYHGSSGDVFPSKRENGDHHSWSRTGSEGDGRKSSVSRRKSVYSFSGRKQNEIKQVKNNHNYIATDSLNFLFLL